MASRSAPLDDFTTLILVVGVGVVAYYVFQQWQAGQGESVESDYSGAPSEDNPSPLDFGTQVEDWAQSLFAQAPTPSGGTGEITGGTDAMTGTAAAASGVVGSIESAFESGSYNPY